MAARTADLGFFQKAGMYLRNYRSSDLSVLFALDMTCFDPPFRFSRAAMRRFAEAQGALVRLACEQTAREGGERLLGFSIVHLQRANGSPGRLQKRLQRAKKTLIGYIVTLDVAPEYRGQGVARTLIAALEAEAAEAGASAMELHVFADNAPAIRLYEGLGYSFLEVVPNFYGKALDARIYRKGLDAPADVPTPSSSGATSKTS